MRPMPYVLHLGVAADYEDTTDHRCPDWFARADPVGRPKLQVAHAKLSRNRTFAVRTYSPQPHEMLFGALTQAFRMFGGVPR